MSSWLPPTVSPVLLVLLGLTLGCDRQPSEQARATQPVEAPPRSPEPAPAPLPWFQGEWRGGSAAGAAPAEGSVTLKLTIDGSGAILGSSSLDLSLRGVIDGETARLDAEGPSGHGVAVLHRQEAQLQGVLRYAPALADHGKSVHLTLTRAELP